MRNLSFRLPPRPIQHLIGKQASIGLFQAMPNETPVKHYANKFFEEGHTLALPWFDGPSAQMQFRHWEAPYLDGANLSAGPFGPAQPTAEQVEIVPDVLFIPLLAATPNRMRLGQGGGHYDRWLAAHPDSVKIGMAWDCQIVDTIPEEPHDIRLDAIITPTRVYS